MDVIQSTIVIRSATDPTVEYQYMTVTRDDVTELTAIKLLTPIEETEQIELEMSYRGPITDDMSGMYYSHYLDEGSGERKYVLCTVKQNTNNDT